MWPNSTANWENNTAASNSNSVNLTGSEQSRAQNLVDDLGDGRDVWFYGERTSAFDGQTTLLLIKSDGTARYYGQDETWLSSATPPSNSEMAITDELSARAYASHHHFTSLTERRSTNGALVVRARTHISIELPSFPKIRFPRSLGFRSRKKSNTGRASSDPSDPPQDLSESNASLELHEQGLSGPELWGDGSRYEMSGNPAAVEGAPSPYVEAPTGYEDEDAYAREAIRRLHDSEPAGHTKQSGGSLRRFFGGRRK